MLYLVQKLSVQMRSFGEGGYAADYFLACLQSAKLSSPCSYCSLIFNTQYENKKKESELCEVCFPKCWIVPLRMFQDIL